MNRIPNQPFSVEIVAVYGIKSNPFYLILLNEVRRDFLFTLFKSRLDVSPFDESGSTFRG